MYGNYGNEYYGQQPLPPTSFLHSPDSSHSSGVSMYSDGSPDDFVVPTTPMQTPCFPGQQAGGGLQEFQRQMALAQQAQRPSPPSAQHQVPGGEMSMVAGTPMVSPCFPGPQGPPGPPYQEYQRQMAPSPPKVNHPNHPGVAAPPVYGGQLVPANIEEINRLTIMQAQAASHANAIYAWAHHMFQQPPPYNIYANHPYALTPDLIQDAFQVAHARAMANQQQQPQQQVREKENDRKVDKDRGRRTPFTSRQLAMLIARFNQSNSIRIEERRQFSKVIGLSEEQIKVWFQNRRFKLRTDAKRLQKAKEQREEEPDEDQRKEDVEKEVLEGKTFQELGLYQKREVENPEDDDDEEEEEGDGSF